MFSIIFFHDHQQQRHTRRRRTLVLLTTSSRPRPYRTQPTKVPPEEKTPFDFHRWDSSFFTPIPSPFSTAFHFTCTQTTFSRRFRYDLEAPEHEIRKPDSRKNTDPVVVRKCDPRNRLLRRRFFFLSFCVSPRFCSFLLIFFRSRRTRKKICCSVLTDFVSTGRKYAANRCGSKVQLH